MSDFFTANDPATRPIRLSTRYGETSQGRVDGNRGAMAELAAEDGLAYRSCFQLYDLTDGKSLFITAVVQYESEDVEIWRAVWSESANLLSKMADANAAKPWLRRTIQ